MKKNDLLKYNDKYIAYIEKYVIDMNYMHLIVTSALKVLLQWK